MLIQEFAFDVVLQLRVIHADKWVNFFSSATVEGMWVTFWRACLAPIEVSLAISITVPALKRTEDYRAFVPTVHAGLIRQRHQFHHVVSAYPPPCLEQPATTGNEKGIASKDRFSPAENAAPRDRSYDTG
jgi:hypothetical protein